MFWISRRAHHFRPFPLDFFCLFQTFFDAYISMSSSITPSSTTQGELNFHIAPDEERKELFHCASSPLFPSLFSLSDSAPPAATAPASSLLNIEHWDCQDCYIPLDRKALKLFVPSYVSPLLVPSSKLTFPGFSFPRQLWKMPLSRCSSSLCLLLVRMCQVGLAST